MRSSHPRSPIDHPSNGSKKSNFGQLRSLSKPVLNFNFVFLGVTCTVLDPLGAQAVCRLGHLLERSGDDVLGESTSYIFKI
jgi:hypothetical protein